MNLDYILAIFEATFRVVLTPNFSEQVLYLKFQSDVGAFWQIRHKKAQKYLTHCPIKALYLCEHDS